MSNDKALIEEAHEAVRDLQSVAWSRSDGGQEASLYAGLIDRLATALEAASPSRGDALTDAIWLELQRSIASSGEEAKRLVMMGKDDLAYAVRLALMAPASPSEIEGGGKVVVAMAERAAAEGYDLTAEQRRLIEKALRKLKDKQP